jgi:hypothetical protein
MNFFQKVSIISTEILAESEYRFVQISRRKMMHFLSTLSQKVGVLSVEFFQKVSIISTKFPTESEYFFCQIFRRKPVLFLPKFSQKMNIVSVKFLTER